MSTGLVAALSLFVIAGLPMAAESPQRDGVQASAAVALMTLPDELRVRFRDAVLDRPGSRQERFDRLLQFVFDAKGLGMTYSENGTHTVAQSYATRTANCLGFTILVLALAREAGIAAHPQEIGEALAWRELGGTLFRSSHVNVRVRIGNRKFTVDVARNAAIPRYRPERISDQRLEAHYFNNLAVEAQENGQGELALQHLYRALALDPDNAGHWSNLGVFLARREDFASAERAYIRALELDPNQTSALHNMVGLSHRAGDPQREAAFRQRLAAVSQEDPFFHFMLAIEYERAGDLDLAIDHYRRAIRLHRKDHRLHSALARAQMLAGDVAGARKSIVRAQALSEGTTRTAYQAKWERMRSTADANRACGSGVDDCRSATGANR